MFRRFRGQIPEVAVECSCSGGKMAEHAVEKLEIEV